MTWRFLTDANIMGALASRQTQEYEFWQRRYKDALASGRNVNDAVNAGFDWRVIDPIHKAVLAYYGITEHSKVLDVGCGMGRTSEWFDPASYIGFDFVPEFIDEAKKQHPKHEFFVHNIIQEPKLPFKDREFDVSIGISFQVVTRPNVTEDQWFLALTEIRRVSKKTIFLEFANGVPEETAKADVYEW